MTLASLLWRAAAVAVVYALSRTVAGGVAVALGGRPSGDPLAAFALELAAGLVIGLSLGWVASRLAGTAGRRVVAITMAIFVSILAVMIEGAAFAPELSPAAALPSAALLQLAVAAVTALAITRLFGRPAGPTLAVPRRAPWSWAWRYAAAALTYVVLYLVTGAVNYALVTRPYYETHAGGLVVPAPAVVLGVSLLEGALFPLAVLPLIYLLRTSRRDRALIAGAVLFLLGGVVPLLVVSPLPVFLRVASGWEILFQKLPAGAAAALLLGPTTGSR